MTFKEQYQYSFLIESRRSRYIEFFQDFIKTTKVNTLYDSNNDVEQLIHKRINQAINVLKREDRIAWYLRSLKYVLYMHLLSWNDPELTWGSDGRLRNPEKEITVPLPKYVTQYLYKTTGKEHRELPAGVIKGVVVKRGSSYLTPALLDTFEHFLSLPIPSIADYRFENQSEKNIIDYFTLQETEWKERGGDREFDITDELNSGVIEQFLTFDSGKYGWFNLKRASCSQEGQSMGHCGNSPRSNTNDTILSFRSIKKYKNHVIAVPHLTFILTEDGHLTESKGHGNSKPATKYHPYIIALLLYKKGTSYLIKKIVGGGYREENNFYLTDLPKEEYQKLIKQRPELKSQPA